MLVDGLLEKYILRLFKVSKNIFLKPLMVGNSGWFVLQDKYVSDFLLSIFSDSPQGFEILLQSLHGLES